MALGKIETQELIFVGTGFVTILINVIEIAFILKLKKKSSFDKLILSLAASDLLVGIVVTAFKIVDFIYGQQTWLEEDIFSVVFVMSSLLSMKNLLAITIDRYLTVRFPIGHRFLVTGRRVNKALVIIWFTALFVDVGANALLLLAVRVPIEYYLLASTLAIILWGIFISSAYVWILRLLLVRPIPGKARTTNDHKKLRAKLQLLFRGQCRAERMVICTSLLV